MTIPSPEIEWVEEMDSAILMTDQSNGAVFFGRRAQADTRRFHLQWGSATQTQRDQLFAESAATLGGAGTTTYTPVDGSAVTVWFHTPPSASRSKKFYQMSCVFQEVYTPY